MIGLCGLCGSHGSRLNDTISCQTRSRSVPDVVVLNSPNPVGSLIKCQRLPRGFFWNSFFPVLVCSMEEFARCDGSYCDK